MKQSELKVILKDHELWLDSGREKGKRADLWRANLQDANLQDANLQGANLQGANLHDANLMDANLHNVNLTGANLIDANLQDANLQDADFASANLEGAKFTTNFKKVRWFYDATFSEDQLPWVVLNPKYPEWANTLKWVKVKQLSA